MNSRISAFAVITLMFLTCSPLLAQQRPRISPHDTISTVVDRDRVMIVYGRPYTKDPKTGDMRKIWGGLVPYGKVWRTGADEATLLITQQPIMIADTTIPAGAYTLFTLPADDGTCKLIVNKQIGQWGLQYDPKQDLAAWGRVRGAIATRLRGNVRLHQNPCKHTATPSTTLDMAGPQVEV